MKISVLTKPVEGDRVEREFPPDDKPGELGPIVRTWKFRVRPIDGSAVLAIARECGAKTVADYEAIRPCTVVAMATHRAIAIAQCEFLEVFDPDGKPATVDVNGEPKSANDVRDALFRNFDYLALDVGITARNGAVAVENERGNSSPAPA